MACGLESGRGALRAERGEVAHDGAWPMTDFTCVFGGVSAQCWLSPGGEVPERPRLEDCERRACQMPGHMCLMCVQHERRLFCSGRHDACGDVPCREAVNAERSCAAQHSFSVTWGAGWQLRGMGYTVCMHSARSRVTDMINDGRSARCFATRKKTSWGFLRCGQHAQTHSLGWTCSRPLQLLAGPCARLCAPLGGFNC